MKRKVWAWSDKKHHCDWQASQWTLGRNERVWLNSLHIMLNVKVSATPDRQYNRKMNSWPNRQAKLIANITHMIQIASSIQLLKILSGHMVNQLAARPDKHA